MQDLQKNLTSEFQNIINARPQGHVLALCLHPALDVTIHTDHGREISRRENLGGKAVNVARMLHLLGARVTLLAPDDCAGETSELLANCGFDCELIPTNLSLRRNYKYIDADGKTREQNGSAGTLSPQHSQQLIDRVLHICRTRQITHLALCGSFPQGVEKAVYKSLIGSANALDISCVTDASGDALSLAVQAKPALIKPNMQEFSTLSQQSLSMLKTEEAVEKAIFNAYLKTGVQILCSMDKDGSIYAGAEGIYFVKSPEVEHVNSFAGAGDTMLASFLYARYLCAAPIGYSLRFASAAATAKVKLPASTLPMPQEIFAEWTHTQIRGKAEHEIYQK